MILPFSTQLNGKPTYFPEKIIKGLFEAGLLDEAEANKLMWPLPFERNGHNYLIKFDKTIIVEPKIFTIREDITNRWKTGMLIDFFINSRKPDMLQFAPRVPLLGKQRIFMTDYNGLEISIDGRQIFGSEIDDLYKNDGFDSYEDFEDYFLSRMKEGEFSAKILHWTDKRF